MGLNENFDPFYCRLKRMLFSKAVYVMACTFFQKHLSMTPIIEIYIFKESDIVLHAIDNIMTLNLETNCYKMQQNTKNDAIESTKGSRNPTL
jgi:hypothetical protein